MSRHALKTEALSDRAKDTRNSILDAAEELFSDLGYDGASIREIANQANVRLANVTYYFPAKHDLFLGVVGRRSETLNELRLEALEKVLKGGTLTVEAILTAYLEPYFTLMKQGGSGWKNYSVLIAQIAQRKRWLDTIQEHFNPTARQFISALEDVMPDVPSEYIIQAFVYFIQLMVSELVDNQRAATLADSKTKRKLKHGYKNVIRFAVGGFVALTESA